MLTGTQIENLLAVARKACELARREGVDAAVAGGIALNYYGVPRLTSDVDVIVGEPLRIDSQPLAIAGQRTSIDGIEVDYLWCSGPHADLYREALEHARPTEHGFPIVPDVYLAAIKTVVSRSRDIEDLERLLQIFDPERTEKARAIVERHAPGALADFEASAYIADLRRKVGHGP